MPELELSGTRKAAIFLAALGADVSAKIFRNLEEEEIEVLSTELSRLPDVDEGVTSSVLKEFFEMALTQQYITSGGLSYATEIPSPLNGFTPPAASPTWIHAGPTAGFTEKPVGSLPPVGAPQAVSGEMPQ